MKKLIFVIVLIATIFYLNAYTEVGSFNEFVKISPDTQENIPLDTNVSVYYDNQNLYVEWDVVIDDNFVKGRKSQNDNYDDCDYLRIQLITSPKDQYAYFFIAYPDGHKLDGIRDKDLNISYEWNSDYSYTNTFSEDNWHCLMVIPFKSLRYPDEYPYKWQVIFARYFSHDESHYSYPYVTNNFRQLYFTSGADIVINEELQKRLNLTFKPYALYNYDFNTKNSSFGIDNFGMDIETKNSTSFNTKISINPDFSDVPLDDEIDISNIKYIPTFPENRFFFNEDVDVFNMNNIVFYTRNIVKPQLAVKATGYNNAFSYGILYAKDKEIFDDDVLINSDDDFGAFALNYRSNRNIINNSMFFRKQDDAYNLLWKFEPRRYIDNSKWVQFTNIYSLYSEGDETTNGYITGIEYNHNINDFTHDISINTYNKNFVNKTGTPMDLGYSNASYNLSYNIESEKTLKSYRANFSLCYSLLDSNKKLERYVGLSNSLGFKNNIDYSTSIYIDKMYFNDKQYRNYNLFNQINYTNRRSFGFGMNCSFSNNLVYALEKNKESLQLGEWYWHSLFDNAFLYVSVNEYRYLNLDNEEKNYIDPKYELVNVELQYLFNKDIALNSGLRYNNYEVKLIDYEGSYGFYSYLSVNFLKSYYLYMGFNTQELKYASGWDIDHQLFYVKIKTDFSL